MAGTSNPGVDGGGSTSPRTDAEGRASASFLLAALLFVGVQITPPVAQVDCPRPRLHPAAEGGSPLVSCLGVAGSSLTGPVRLLFGLPLDPNREEPATLEVLPGIGPVRAAAIVRERERRPFCGVDELERVRGIGPRTLARVMPFLTAMPSVDCRSRLPSGTH